MTTASPLVKVNNLRPRVKGYKPPDLRWCICTWCECRDYHPRVKTGSKWFRCVRCGNLFLEEE